MNLRAGRTPIVLLLGFLLALAASAQNAGSAGKNDQGDTERELKDIDQQWLRAATVQDVHYLHQLFADGMFEVQNGGSVVTGAEMQRYLAIPGRKVDITIDDVQVRGIYGDTAVLTDHTAQTGMTADGRKIAGDYTVMRVLHKIDGKWRAIGANMTPRKAATSARANHDQTAARPESDLSPLEKEIVALDHKWVDAATRGDTAFLKTLFGENMFEVQPDGHPAPAAEMLERIATRKPGQIEGYCDQVQVRGVYGDTVILTDRRVRKGNAANGQDVSGQWRVTRVFVKQNGQWRAVAAAMTPIQ